MKLNASELITIRDACTGAWLRHKGYCNHCNYSTTWTHGNANHCPTAKAYREMDGKMKEEQQRRYFNQNT